MKSYNGFTPYQRQQHHDWLKAAIKMGVVPEPKVCAACSQERGKIEYHAEDYNWKFIPGIVLCYRCHTMVHLRDSHPEFWAEYRQAIREGARFAPALSFGEVLHHVQSGSIDSAYFDIVEANEVDVLGMIDSGAFKPKEIVKPPRNWRQLIESELGIKP
jgi:hypothetical protein